MKTLCGWLVIAFLIACGCKTDDSSAAAKSVTDVPPNQSLVVVAKCNYGDSADNLLVGDPFVYLLADKSSFTGDWTDPKLLEENNGILFVVAGLVKSADTLRSPEILAQGDLPLRDARLFEFFGDRPSYVAWTENANVFGFSPCDKGQSCITSNGSHPNGANAYPDCYFRY